MWGSSACGRALWRRYLEVFSTVLIVARMSDVSEPSAGLVEASQDDVEFLPLPPYSGPVGLVKNLREVHRRAVSAVRESPAVIVRTPSPVAYFMCRAAREAGRPFGAEVVGDPREVFSRGGYTHALRPAIRTLATAAQKRVATEAAAVLYVTSEALQRRYPTLGRSYAASDVVLDDTAFTTGPPRGWTRRGPFVIVTVAALDQPYKGSAFLLDAMSRLCRGGASAKLRLVGGGRLLPGLRQQSETLGLSEHVEFLGQQDQAGVREALDSAHLFVLPSLQEGLPRALLEAMARGLPAVATAVGGVPELLPRDCLVSPRDARALATRIEEQMVDEPARLRHAERNRSTARRYHERLGADVRRQFLQQVKAAAAEHLECQRHA